MSQQSSMSAAPHIAALLNAPLNRLEQLGTVPRDGFKSRSTRPAFNHQLLNRETRRLIKRQLSREFQRDTAFHPPISVRRTRFNMVELLSMKFPEQVFLVKDLIPKGLLMLAGPPKAGKSWMLLDMAYQVASGRGFLDREVDQGAVLYLALEDTPRRLAERIQMVAPNVYSEDIPLEMWTECPRLDAGGLTEIEAWLRQAQNPKLVIIDVWGRFTPLSNGPTRNDYETVTAHLQPIQSLANKYGITIVLTHHTRKTSGDAQGGDPFDQVLGSRALTSNMDCTLVLTRSRFQDEAILGVTGRDLEEAQHSVTFNKLTHRWEPSNRESAPALSPQRQQVLDVVTAGMGNTSDIAKRLNKSPQAVHNLLAGLLKEGLLVRAHRGNYMLPPSEEPGVNDQWPSVNLEDLI